MDVINISIYPIVLLGGLKRAMYVKGQVHMKRIVAVSYHETCLTLKTVADALPMCSVTCPGTTWRDLEMFLIVPRDDEE